MLIKGVAIDKSNEKNNELMPDENKERYIRVIFNGKLLDPDQSLLSSFNLKNDSFVHAIVNYKQKNIPSNITTSTTFIESSERKTKI